MPPFPRLQPGTGTGAPRASQPPSSPPGVHSRAFLPWTPVQPGPCGDSGDQLWDKDKRLPSWGGGPRETPAVRRERAVSLQRPVAVPSLDGCDAPSRWPCHPRAANRDTRQVPWAEGGDTEMSHFGEAMCPARPLGLSPWGAVGEERPQVLVSPCPQRGEGTVPGRWARQGPNGPQMCAERA